VQNWTHSKERLLPDVSPARKKEIDTHNAGVDKQIVKCKTRIDGLRKHAEPRALEAKLAALPEAERGAVGAVSQDADVAHAVSPSHARPRGSPRPPRRG